jgi:hypothetical protein
MAWAYTFKVVEALAWASRAETTGIAMPDPSIWVAMK